VGVDVDEAGRDDQAGCVDDVGRVRLGERSNRRDAPVLDADVGAAPRRAGPVDDLTAGEEKVLLRRLSGEPVRGHDRDRQDAENQAARDAGVEHGHGPVPSILHRP
jgi:hypothetical protein